MRLRHVPVPCGWRTINVGGTKVRATLTRQHKQYYAVGKDVKGNDRCGIGSSVKEACKSLQGMLTAVNRSYARQR